MQKGKKVNENIKMQNMEDISNHEGISDKFDELGPKECALADEMQDFEKKVESKKGNKYLSGKTNEDEKIIAFLGDELKEKRPFITAYFRKDN